MMRHRFGLAVLVAAGIAALTSGARPPVPPGACPLAPQPAAVPAAAQQPAQQPAGKASAAEAGITKAAAEYEKAFNAADAKGCAALYTAEAEYTSPDGEVLSGRAAIEKGLAEYFKANPKLRAEVRVEKVRPLGATLASAEGVVRLKVPGDDSVTESRYSALHALEDGVWRVASVQEWVPDPATDLTIRQMEWMIGEWTARGERGEVKLAYKWDENKVFINGTYELTKDGKRLAYGTQVFGANPGGGIRAWTFDSSGTTIDGLWVRDDTRWLNEATGVLPDGSAITSLNVIVPLGPDAFTWQTTDRAANDVPLPALPPVKVTRVKK